MKLAILALLPFFFTPLYSSAKKAPIASIQFSKDTCDLIASDYFRFGFIITRQDSTVSRTSGFLNGGFPWRKLYIKSNQGHMIYNGKFHFHREAVYRNNNQITIFIQLTEGKISYFDTVNLKLPTILDISLDTDSIVPYTSYNKSLKVAMDNGRVYHLTNKSMHPGLIFSDFKLHIPENLNDNGSHFSYSPKNLSSLKKINLVLINKKLSYSSLISLHVATVEKLSINGNGSNGIDGSDGSDGYDGDDGEDGSGGDDGYDGSNGQNGNAIEVLVRNISQDKIQLIVFYQDQEITYYLSKNALINIQANGGIGGDGGTGGDGGDGGGPNDLGVCGSDGSDGSDGCGGNGGNGGNIKIFTDMSIKQTAYIFTIKNNGGSGGSGYSAGEVGKKGMIEFTVLSSKEIEKLFNDYETN
ncbi:MAG: hypothetical protein HKP14_10795 [Bacteroidia bacterium]|nr:hypothetical protein [Bacteroidia bacterium]